MADAMVISLEYDEICGGSEDGRTSVMYAEVLAIKTLCIYDRYLLCN